MDNNAFNIFVWGKKKVGMIKLCDGQTPNSKGEIISFETQLAIVSHYLQNKGTIYETTYRAISLKIIQYWSKKLPR
ncbi:MAG: hypothetical protein IKW97_09710 [Muribaculaceae bacterium]|nr:hypothetical protein [Muribaculaceae bacterium]